MSTTQIWPVGLNCPESKGSSPGQTCYPYAKFMRVRA